MPSFISSFRGIAVTAAVCVAVYCVVIATVGVKPLLYPDQNLSNIARTEQALLRPEKLSTVIVGSSLAARLPESLWTDDTLNLALGGHNALTGLDILASRGARPDIVLIETNWITRQTNSSFVDQLDGSLLRPVRPYVDGLQVQNQPINHLLSAALSLTRRQAAADSCGEILKSGSKPQEASQTQISFLTPPVFSEPDIRKAVARLAANVEDLKQNGTDVILVEIPMSQAFAQATGPTRLRQAIGRQFPDLEFWTFDHAAFETTDGQHLTPASADKFGCILLEKLTQR